MELDCAIHDGPSLWDDDKGRKHILQWTFDMDEERLHTAEAGPEMEVDEVTHTGQQERNLPLLNRWDCPQDWKGS